MNKYDLKDWSYGVELEFADVSIHNKLPEGASWNLYDYSIVNSNGIANDPKGVLYEFGGEINTKPTNTIEEQVQHIQDIIDMLDPKPVINYKCNLHIHIRVPGLRDDLEACKKVIKYIHDSGKQAFEIVDPLTLPTKQQYPYPSELEGAKKRYRRNQTSHQYMLPDTDYEKVINANTLQEFYLGHRLVSQRPGINMRPMFDNGGNGTNTIEFRHFFGTLDPLEYKSCLTWCMEFLNAALNTGEEPKDIIKRNLWMVFPRAKKYDHTLHQNFEKTEYKLPLEERKKNIEEILQKQKVIYESFTDEEIQDIIKDHTKPKKRSLFE